jgi:hypothetical protein
MRDESSRHPKKADTTNTSTSETGDRESTFRQPSYKPKIFEREDFGIVSPSDLRRPQEGPYVKVVGKKDRTEDETSKQVRSVQSPSISAAKPSTPEVQEKPSASNVMTSKLGVSAEQPTAASGPKSVFVKDFFANKPQRRRKG